MTGCDRGLESTAQADAAGPKAAIRLVPRYIIAREVTLLFIDELTRIQETEAKADQMVRDARSGSKRTLEEARTQAQKILTDAEGRAKEIYDGFISEGEKISAKEYDEFMKKTQADSDAMIAKAAAKKQQAVDLIAERIVNTSVNR